MSDAYVVEQYGTDSSGRPIYLNRRMKAAYEAVTDHVGFDPVIVQGAYMDRVSGGGADASAGYHDKGGCIDTRTWDIDSDEERAVIRAARSIGWAVWRRDQRHGMEEHMHWVLLGDQDAADGAVWQMHEYRAGRDGLSSRGPDYHWRPDPIPTYHYTEDWFDMATKKELREVVDAALAAERPKIVQQVRHDLLHETDVFPNDPQKKTTVNDVLAKLSSSLEPS